MVSHVAFLEPIPVLKGKAAQELVSKLFWVAKPPKKKAKRAGSREVYLKLRPRD